MNPDPRPATEAKIYRAWALTEDVAELWRREWRPGQYYPALETIAARIRRTPRTVERHVARARKAGLL